ncbi:hypothetical protein EDB80DRAFT_675699 [Ilyonectria destructans]|nr:hypothetical protein EDB80DRAFT_675699 [Ilyonectria destructans]
MICNWITSVLPELPVISELSSKVVELESHFDVHAPAIRDGWADTWRAQANTGSRVLYDLGSHLIDQALVLLGKPKTVTAVLGYERVKVPLRQPRLHDHLTSILERCSCYPESLRHRHCRQGSPLQGPRRKRNVYQACLTPVGQYHLDIQEPQIVDGAAEIGRRLEF